MKYFDSLLPTHAQKAIAICNTRNKYKKLFDIYCFL